MLEKVGAVIRRREKFAYGDELALCETDAENEDLEVT